jgi:Na+/phosphate symporter
MKDSRVMNINLVELEREVNRIHEVIYMMLEEVEREFKERRLNTKSMVEEFSDYIRNIYEEQVFRSVTKNTEVSNTHQEYKKIVKKMRENR